MIEFTAEDFRELCRSETVSERIGSIEAQRQIAVRTFWSRLAAGAVVTVAAFWLLSFAGWPTTAWIIGALSGLATFIIAAAPLRTAIESLKHPVLAELARRAGMEYYPCDFEPPVFSSAQILLFDGALSNRSFADLFNGVDKDGLGWAVYEADLQRRMGRHSYTVFSGQIYALQRQPGAAGITTIVPDRGILNFWKPARDMDRVRIEADSAFERKFEVYSTHAEEAGLLLRDPELRAHLLELRKAGRVWVFIAPDEALVAAWGKNRFEPGSMFRSVAGEERARMMFEDLRASIVTLLALKAHLG